MTAIEKRHQRQSNLEWIAMYRALWRDFCALRAEARQLRRQLRKAVPRELLERVGARLEALAKRAGGRMEDFALVDELRALLEATE